MSREPFLRHGDCNQSGMAFGISIDPTEIRVRAAYGYSEPGIAFADPDLSSEATCTDPARCLPVIDFTGDLPDELLIRLTTTLGSF